jgi:predicted enzyme related to lactoylglutathione lyase
MPMDVKTRHCLPKGVETMTQETVQPSVLQMRLVVEVEDYEQAVAFFRDALGLPERAAFRGDGEARVAILDAGRATLEIANAAQKAMIDRVEADGRVSPRIRFAFEVTDAITHTQRLVEAGADLVAEPRETPWRSLNSRLNTPGGLQVTLFQELMPTKPGERG